MGGARLPGELQRLEGVVPTAFGWKGSALLAGSETLTQKLIENSEAADRQSAGFSRVGGTPAQILPAMQLGAPMRGERVDRVVGIGCSGGTQRGMSSAAASSRIKQQVKA
jgi:hypothetical protein